MLWIAAWESGFQGEICEQAKTAGQENCATYGVALFLTIKIGEFFDNHGGAIAAFATIAIAAFTWTLWQSTDKLWRAGEKQLEHAQTEATTAQFDRQVQFDKITEQIEILRQSTQATEESARATRDLVHTTRNNAQLELRAYIGIEWAKISSNDGGNTFVGEIQIRNTGETPAFRVTHCITSQVFQTTQPLNLGMPNRSPGNLPIAPGMSFTLRTPVVVGNMIATIGGSSGQRFIVVWGKVDYFDFFGFPHYLTFRFRSVDPIRAHDGTVMRTVGWRMDAEDEGNDAD